MTVRPGVNSRSRNHLTDQSPIRLRALGPLELQLRDSSVLPRRRKELALLVYLLRRSPRAVARTTLATLLWEDRDAARARQSLRQALTEIRRAVPGVLRVTASDVRAEPHTILLDVHDFEAAVRDRRFGDAVALWHGEFLAGADDAGGEEYRAWLEAERTTLRRLLARSCEALVDQAEQAGDWPAAVARAEWWCSSMPLDERAHLRLVKALRLANRPAEAADRHLAFTTRLRCEIGVEPGPEFLLLSAPHAGASPGVVRGRVPTPDLVGREDSFRALTDSWRETVAGGWGIVVVEGEEGQGKTRLLEEFARSVRAGEGQATLLQARAYEAEREAAFSTARHLFDGMADVPLLATASPGDLARIAELLPRVGERFRHLPAPPASTGPGAALSAVLRAVSSESPVLITLDDAACADDQSQRLLGELVRRPVPGILLVLGAGTGSLQRGPLASDLRQNSAVHRLRLPPLDAQQVARMVRSMTGMEAGQLRVLAGRLERHSAGNPGRVHRELLHLADEGMLLRDADGTWSLDPAFPGSAPLPGEAGGHSRGRFRRVLGAGVLAVAALAVFVALRDRGAGPRRVHVAVMPLETRGASAPGLGEAVTELLGLALDDDYSRAPGELVRYLRGRATLDSGYATIEASLHEEATGTPPLATARVFGPVDELSTLVSALAADLLGDSLAPQPRFALEGIRTRSLPALRLYLAGERQARRMEMESAAQSYWQAIRADPAFAAAWHALARVNGWFALGDRERALSDSAFGRARSLAPRQQLVLDGWRWSSRGHPDLAERRFSAVLAFAPHATEANVGMGEVLLHHNWSRGRSPAEARSYWESAHRADPGDWRPLSHLWALRARDGQREDAAASLEQLVQRLGGIDSAPAYRLALAVLRDDSLEVEHRMRSLTAVSAWELATLSHVLASPLERPDLAQRAAAELASARHTSQVRALGQQRLARLALAAGRWRDAQEHARAAEALDRPSGMALAAELWTTPFVPAGALPGTVRQALQRRLTAYSPAPQPRTFLFWFDFDRTRQWIIHPYLAALLNAQGPGAPSGSRPLVPLPGAQWPDSLQHLRQQLQRSLDAWEAASRGDDAGVQASLTGSWVGTYATAAEYSSFHSRPWDRYLLATTLERMGRDTEALGWFEGLRHGPSLADYAYAAPASLHMARIHERLGNHELATACLRDVLRLWAGADPVFQPSIDSAHAAIERLAARRAT